MLTLYKVYRQSTTPKST